MRSSISQVDPTRSGLWRSRWAAIGAAVAVTLGGGGLFAVSAASPESSVVALEPTRILDTRDPVNVGLAGPFASPASQELQVTGAVPTTTGTQTVVPTGATGVFLNVTPVGSTAAGFISVRPATATGVPSTSNVNFAVGAINPNAVLVELPVGGADDGTIEITFDAFGVAGPTTDVLVDVVGYTTDTKLKALEATLAASTNELWGYVTSTGGVHASNGGVAVSKPATGTYCLRIPRRGAHKATQVTSADPSLARIVSAGTGHGSACNPLFDATHDAIPVYVRDVAGTLVDGNFTYLIPAG